MEEPTASLSGLRSQRSSQRLEEIANLRSRGIGEHISLPQLVVCGDQSAGKSSVLEGITGLPFPRQDGICTRFATEIMLMHTEGPIYMQAEIIPSQFRIQSAKDELAAYRRTIADFRKLPMVTTEAGTLIGVRGFGESDVGTTFAQDVLRIKVIGEIGLHLTVVDLLGLIAVVNEQQTEDDVQAVHSLVDSYVENSRTIILAVVQANNDIANQGIIQKSKMHDRRGERTIGIITKPNLLNTSIEGRIAALARN
jgi:GTPase SAR1 family protein